MVSGHEWKNVGIFLGVVFGVAIAHFLFFWLLKRIAKLTTQIQVDDDIALYLRWPTLPVSEAAGLLILFGVYFDTRFSTRTSSDFIHAIKIILILGIGWSCIALAYIVERQIYRSHHYQIADKQEMKQIKTQVAVFRRLFIIMTLMVTVAVCLLTFETVRTVGVGMLVSAGLLAVCLGVAAGPFLTALYSSLQIAIAQPIRIDDVVIVDGEWGKVEEINATYAVVAIWDQRRLICPLSKFLQNSFQNWTKNSEELMGTVFIYVDYTVDVEDMRSAAENIIKSAPQWDGRVANLQVTDLKELRLLMSARNADDLWNIRVYVRERILRWTKEHYPNALPKIRAEVEKKKRSAPLLRSGVEPISDQKLTTPGRISVLTTLDV